MKNILIIDDSEASLYLLQSIFDEEPKITAHTEIDSTKAISRIKELPPDLLLIDIMIPKIDGIQLIQQIKADNEIKDIPIIVISAKTDNETIKKVMQLGVKEYIKKPIDLDEIEVRIRNILM